MNKLHEHSIAALTWLSVYFAPTYPAIMAIGFFVFCDLITAIAAARKAGESIQSKKLKCTVWKFAAYGIAILVAHVIEKQFLPDFPTVKIIAGFIAYVEVKSIDENIKKTTGLSFFKIILDKLGAKYKDNK